MTQQFIRDMFHNIDTRDFEKLRDFFTDDVVYERPGYDPIRGIEDLLHFYREVRVIALGKHGLTRVVVDDESGASWGRFEGEHRNGKALDVRFADVYTFENGKIKTRASYFFEPSV
jgi:ketosteroid isomerase-like protein